ncbi:hypothetical protein AMJ44_11825 [candidate division WOR-1 bacterium DG_54_3]|uniref:Lycopene cyclase domain-containing protein n=1 Tax=candidate division WOR-1 bacterium DG_54_3 TaxID=1703775 RepID=A0A0S7XRE7_UNCSA|nr:MAG: hypothetical protein AMJ44_11825 [candidate division WOR-1 bacterium DG_54_3]
MFKNHAIIGLLVLIISGILLYFKIEPVSTCFYIFAWWSFIIILDGFIYQKTGQSLIRSRTREFVFMIVISNLFWLIFEGYNFFIKNWYYINAPSNILWRRLASFLAFGTVLPAIFSATELLESYGLLKNFKIEKLNITKDTLRFEIVLGLIFIIFPFIFPEHCFPLIWGGFIFLLDPINYKFGGRSLLRDLENGSIRKLCMLLLGGLICGIFWEFWNFWAGSKWVYSIPISTEQYKLFEMPLLGFVGFPPFAVECYVMYSFITLLKEKLINNKLYLKMIFWVIIFSVIFLLLHFLDKYTILSFTS